MMKPLYHCLVFRKRAAGEAREERNKRYEKEAVKYSVLFFPPKKGTKRIAPR